MDEVRARWLALRVAMWKADFRLFCKEVVRVRAKDGSLVPLILNEAQEHLLFETDKMLEEKRWVRIAFLKGRRQGASTFTAARGYWRATLWQRQNIYIMAHEMASSNVLFDMVALMQNNHPFPPAVGTDNAKSLAFSKQGSTYSVATAGQKAGGRGMAISYLHGSEVSRWSNAPDHFASVVQAVDEVRGVWGIIWQEPERPLPFERGKGTIEGWMKAPSEVFLETTSAGPSGEFYSRYMDAVKGIGQYRAVFVPWTLQAEYSRDEDYTASPDVEEEGELSEVEYQQTYGLTDGQMLWRREKIHELGSVGLFRQEYPVDIVEAFSAADIEGVFIKPAYILKARKRKMEEVDAPLILGVDPAGAGGDRFAVVFRRGDKCEKVLYRNKLEHDEAVAWLCALIDEYKPNRVAIDRGSIGSNIISAIRNIDRKYFDLVRGVDFGGKSKAKTVNPTRAGPFNARAEIWGRMRDWLIEGGSIPDDDDLASDLAGPHIKWRANLDYLLESKTDMKARGVRSPDLADALALTFAFQEFFDTWAKPKREAGFGVGVSRLQESVNVNEDFYDSLRGSDTGWMG